MLPAAHYRAVLLEHWRLLLHPADAVLLFRGRVDSRNTVHPRKHLELLGKCYSSCGQDHELEANRAFEI